MISGILAVTYFLAEAAATAPAGATSAVRRTFTMFIWGTILVILLLAAWRILKGVRRPRS